MLTGVSVPIVYLLYYRHWQSGKWWSFSDGEWRGGCSDVVRWSRRGQQASNSV